MDEYVVNSHQNEWLAGIRQVSPPFIIIHRQRKSILFATECSIIHNNTSSEDSILFATECSCALDLPHLIVDVDSGGEARHI